MVRRIWNILYRAIYRIELLQTLLDVPTYTCSKTEADYYSALYDYLKNNQKYARIKEKSALNYSTR